MRKPSWWLTALWLAFALVPLPAVWAQSTPRWVGLAWLAQAGLYFGVGYLGSGRLGYGTALLATLVLGGVQVLWRAAWLGTAGFWWGTLGLDLVAALAGALLWRWRAAHYGADFHFDLIAPWYERLIHPQDPAHLLEVCAWRRRIACWMPVAARGGWRSSFGLRARLLWPTFRWACCATQVPNPACKRWLP